MLFIYHHKHKYVVEMCIEINPSFIGVNTPSSGGSRIVLGKVMNY